MFPARCYFWIAFFCGAVNGLQYKEIFRDDFNGARIDETKWNRVTEASIVNNQLEHYVADETWQEDGKMVLRSQKCNYGGRQYTSGRVDTFGKFNFTYGEVEWRAKLPNKGGKGIWPSLWLRWTKCNAAGPCTSRGSPETIRPEIDVMEARGDIPNKVTATLHYGVYPKYKSNRVETTRADYTADFHTYKVLWDPNQVVFYVDGREEMNITGKNKIPNEPLYLVMKVAIGGPYPGYPDNTTLFPTKFEIDYVTVHRWE